jgi:hypothetical protein
MKLRIGCVVVGFLSLVLSMAAQTSSSSLASAQVPPPLIQFSNVATDEGGSTLSGVVSITFSLYNAQQGGEALWTETQNNIQLDPTGHYSVQLGITQPNGVPTTLFTTGEAHWLGVQIAGQAGQPRVLLLSVPYALKAGDAATIGGLPPSAFVLAAPPNGVATPSGAAPAYATESATEQSVSPATATDVTTTGGTVDFLPVFNGTSTIIDSVVFQSGTGSTAKIGINTTTPASTLGVNGSATIGGLTLPAEGTATASSGTISHPLNLVASTFNSGTSKAVNQTFRWQTEPTGNDTSSPSGTLNLLFGSGTSTPTETGLNIASNGVLTFAPAQTLPGAEVTGDLGDTGQIGNVSATNMVTGATAIFSSSLLAATINATGNLSAGGTVTAAAATITSGITGGSITTTGAGSFGSIVETGNISSFGQGSFGSLLVANAGSINAASLENNSNNATLQLTNNIAPAEGTFMAVFFNGDGKDVFDVDTKGDTFAAGSKSAVVPLRSGEMVELFSMESPEVWFEDFGSGRLAGGATTISLDPRFTQTVNLPLGYHVFLTPKGDCKGLFVTGETDDGFEVRELGGGKSSVEFDYRIVAHRNAYEAKRLPTAKMAVAAKLNRAAAGNNKKK